jgi:hypothetical protein
MSEQLVSVASCLDFDFGSGLADYRHESPVMAAGVTTGQMS